MTRSRPASTVRLAAIVLAAVVGLTTCNDASPTIGVATLAPSELGSPDGAGEDGAGLAGAAAQTRSPAVPTHVARRSADPPAAVGSPEPTGEPTDVTPPSTGSTSSTSATRAARDGEVRAAWVHLFDDSIKSVAGIDRVVSEARSAGVNTLIVQVVRRHDAYYDSSVLPRTPDPRLRDGLDVLAEVIRRAEPAGIAVEAWIVVAPTYHHVYDGLTQPEGWVYRDHGRRAPEGQRWVSRAADGSWSDYLDVALPEVADHVTRVAVEIARGYRVSAVHLDYVRYEGPEWGYHPRALQRFRQETGRGDTPGPSDPQWSDWRRAQATALARQVTRAVHAASPGTKVTAATIAWDEGPRSIAEFRQTRTYRHVFQDWASWAADGTVDAIYPMLYFRSPQHAAWFDRWVAFSGEVARDGRADVAVGIGAWLNPASVTVDQLRRGAAATDGAVVFSWQQPSSGDRAAALAAIRSLWDG